MSVWIPLIAVTAFWALIGIGGPFLVPGGPNKGKKSNRFHLATVLGPFFPIVCIGGAET